MDSSATHQAQSQGREAGPLLSIQVLRAVAALAVVMPHINREFELKLALPDALPLEVFKVGNVGVDLFFVISGFIMVYVSEPLFGRRDAPRSFLLRRFARIIPLYWASSGLLLGYVLLRYSDLAAANMSASAVLASFAFVPYPKPDGSVVPINAIGWTLNYEMFFYAAFAVALLASRGVAVLAVTVAFSLLVTLGLWWRLPGPLAFWADPIVLEFVVGMWIALAFRRGMRLPAWVTYGLLLAGVAIILGGVFWGYELLPRVLGRGVPAGVIIAAVVMANAQATSALGWRVLGFLGDASYALYLTHPASLTLPRILFPGLIDPAAHPWAYAAELVGVAVAVAILVHLAFERPTTRALQQGIAALTSLRRARPIDARQTAMESKIG